MGAPCRVFLKAPNGLVEPERRHRMQLEPTTRGLCLLMRSVGRNLYGTPCMLHIHIQTKYRPHHVQVINLFTALSYLPLLQLSAQSRRSQPNRRMAGGPDLSSSPSISYILLDFYPLVLVSLFVILHTVHSNIASPMLPPIISSRHSCS